MTGHRTCTTSVAGVYPHYVAKAEKKARTQEYGEDASEVGREA
jgi:hypothetical protein